MRTMTIKNLLSRFSIASHQVVRIRDEVRHRTWESEEGCFAFEEYEESPEEIWEYVSKLHVSTFECNEDRLLIWAD